MDERILNRGADTLCISGAPEDTGATSNQDGGLLYPVVAVTQLFGSSAIPIPDKTVVQCSVQFSDNPTVEIWGTSQCPTDWSPVYTGFIMSGHFTHSGGAGTRLCVDRDFAGNIDGTALLNSSAAAAVYPTEFETWAFPGLASFQNKKASCAVCVKNND